ncbi:hypothetical protein [Pseudonocardia adelaidensis]|uniref:hypothetical protein n=1 Tax=Pseudonocardia adelaidensis TaxID=648754 RepID=UPI003CD05A37
MQIGLDEAREVPRVLRPKVDAAKKKLAALHAASAAKVDMRQGRAAAIQLHLLRRERTGGQAVGQLRFETVVDQRARRYRPVGIGLVTCCRIK